jgi:hypothetical protein
VLPGLQKGPFDDYRRDLAFHNWKYAMWDAHCRLPTQTPSGRSQCFCGSEINIDNAREHVYGPHGHQTEMNFVEPRPYADPDVAARKIIELANADPPYFDTAS